MRKEKFTYLPGYGISARGDSVILIFLDCGSFRFGRFQWWVDGDSLLACYALCNRHPFCHLFMNTIRTSSSSRLSPRCRTSHAMRMMRSKPCILHFLDRTMTEQQLVQGLSVIANAPGIICYEYRVFLMEMNLMALIFTTECLNYTKTACNLHIVCEYETVAIVMDLFCLFFCNWSIPDIHVNIDQLAWWFSCARLHLFSPFLK